MKNWLPLVPGPALAMASRPRRSSCTRPELIGEVVAWATHAGAGQVTRLRHEVLEYRWKVVLSAKASAPGRRSC